MPVENVALLIYPPPMPRLFVALRPPDTVRDALIDTMKGGEGARWQEVGQLHLPLRLVGAVDNSQANDLGMPSQPRAERLSHRL